MNTNNTNENSKYRPGTGDIRLRIKAPADRPFPLFHRIMVEGGGYISIDWGDGNKETRSDWNVYSPEHTYAKSGEYIVKLTGSRFKEVIGFPVGDNKSLFQTGVREVLSLKMPTDSTSVSLRKVFYGCANLVGHIPEWDDCVVDVAYAYYGCKGLTGNIPEWGANIVDAESTYENCVRLSGNIPEWGAKMVNAAYTYVGCDSLTGEIPEWGANITDAKFTYAGCSGLTGEIPAWGPKIKSVSLTYSNCSGLTGCSKELLQDPMPSRITKHDDCVYGCVDEIQQHFTKDWGGTKVKLTEARKKFRDVYKALLEKKASY